MLRRIVDSDGKLQGYAFFCPACKHGHKFDLDRWRFNGDMKNPTFEPSLLYEKGVNHPRCHLYLRSGQIQFLSDCSHEMKGQSISVNDERCDP